MYYPFFEVPRLGGGMVIAIIAIVHVFIAHFAVGAGLFLAIGQTISRRRNDAVLLRFLRDKVGVLVLVSFVGGAVTGVGIWIAISLVSPGATSVLIHNFVWGWATEWVFFFVEIAAGYAYYYGWNRLTARRQEAAAWIYAVAAFMSLVIINGILTFMLTPGRWHESLPGDQRFWFGWHNPTFWPSLLLRTVSCLALAGIYAMVIVNLKSRYTDDERRHVIRFASYFLVPLGLMAPLAVWYMVRTPPDARILPFGGAIAMTLFMVFGVAASVLICFHAYFSLIRARRDINLETSVLLMATAFLATGSMEFVREGMRKPHLIYGHLYSNQIPATPQMAAMLERDGVLRHARFAYPPSMRLEQVYRLPSRELGRCVYEAECRMCHEPNGTNAIEAIVPDATRDWVEKTTRQLHAVRRYMPPFLGTEQELQAVVDYQMQLIEAERARRERRARPHGREAAKSTATREVKP